MAKPVPATDQTEHLGVNIVERIVLRELGWIFREQRISDYGIDAHVEIVDDGRPTGRLLALQIKAGPHTQRRPRAGGWTYTVEARHERYWRLHALPVLLVLVDVEEERAWWQHVTPSTLRPTGKNFAVFVPKMQLVEDAAARWRHLASARYVEARVRYPAVLAELPPVTGERLRALHEQRHDDAAVLADHLAASPMASGGAAVVVAELIEAPPPYVDHALAWQGLGAFAAEHGLPELGAVALERAAALDVAGRARLLASAALQLHSAGDARAEALCTAALELDVCEPRALVVRVALAHGVDPGPVRVPEDIDLMTERALADPTVHDLLAVVAQRRGDLHGAVNHRQRALEFAPEETGHQVALAAVLIRRSRGREAQLNDLARAVALLEGAVEQLHRWAGPTREALDQLLIAFASHQDWPGVLRWALPAPTGRATQEEAARPRVLRIAFDAAMHLGEEHLVHQLAQQLGTDGPDGLRRAEALGQDVPRSEIVRVWTEELVAADAAGDDEALVVATFNLARVGVDESRSLDDAVTRGVIPEVQQELVGVLALAAGDLEAALPALRELADRNLTAAEQLVVSLAGAGRTDEAVDAARRAEAGLRQTSFGLLAVDVLSSAGRIEEAVGAAEAALVTGEHAGHAAARLHGLVGAHEAARHDWAAAERHLGRAVDAVTPPRPWRVWNLVLTQLHQHAPRRAAATLRNHPVEVLDETSARIWLDAHRGEDWNAQLSGMALELADRFPDDVPLVDALLNQVILATQGTPPSGHVSDSEGPASEDRRPVVPGELHQRAFELLERHLERHGSRAASRMLAGTPEVLAEQIRDLARRRFELQRDLGVDAVRNGRLPLGFVAAAAGRSPSLAVVERAAGVHVAVSDVDEEHDIEVADADAALGGTVVVDASSLFLGQVVLGRARLAGRFAELRTPEATRRDILTALADARQARGHAGTLVWDGARDGLVHHPNNPEHVERVVADCEALLRAAEATTSAPVNQLDILGDDGQADPHTRDDVNAPWLSPVQLARDEELSLWSDDVVVRGLAREVGVAAFGTAALLEALCRRAIEAVPDGDDAASHLDDVLDRYRDEILALAAAGVVDLPLHLDDLLALAEADDWELGVVAVALMRPSMWRSPGSALLSIDALVQRVSSERPGRREAWVRTAMTGAATAMPYEAEGQALVIAVIAELGGGETLRAIGSVVAQEHGLPDPALMVGRAQHLVQTLRTGQAPKSDRPNLQEDLLPTIGKIDQRCPRDDIWHAAGAGAHLVSGRRCITGGGSRTRTP